jgi:PleD family two-component response regulator
MMNQAKGAALYEAKRAGRDRVVVSRADYALSTP